LVPRDFVFDLLFAPVRAQPRQRPCTQSFSAIVFLTVKPTSAGNGKPEIWVTPLPFQATPVDEGPVDGPLTSTGRDLTIHRRRPAENPSDRLHGQISHQTGHFPASNGHNQLLYS
jgi:hypothetical protein